MHIKGIRISFFQSIIFTGGVITRRSFFSHAEVKVLSNVKRRKHVRGGGPFHDNVLCSIKSKVSRAFHFYERVITHRRN